MNPTYKPLTGLPQGAVVQDWEREGQPMAGSRIDFQSTEPM